MFSSGLFTSFVGVIFNKGELKKVNGTDALSVNFKTSVGTGENRRLIYVEVGFWGSDAVSIDRYPTGHMFEIRGDLLCEAYTNSQNNLAVRYKIPTCSCWQSLQSLPNTQPKQSTDDKQQSSNQKIQPKQSTVNKQPSDQQYKQMDEKEFLNLALNTVLNFGNYSGLSVKKILSQDERYIYDMAANEKLNPKWRKLFATAYNYHYEQKQKNAKKTVKQEDKNRKIQGVNRPFVPANIPENFSDEDLPF